MTVKDVIALIPNFSREEKIELLKRLAESLPDAPQPKSDKGDSADKLRGVLKPDFELPAD